jgi:hypothetical protein
MSGQGLSYPISVYFRTKEVIPLIKIGTIPSTGSVSRGFGSMIGANTISSAKSQDIALSKVMDKNSIQYITNLIRSKGLNFTENLNPNNLKAIYASSKNSVSYAVLINNDSTDDNGALSNDTRLISEWIKLTNPQKNNMPLERSIILIDEYNPSIHRATNVASPMAETGLITPTPVYSMGGRKSKRRKYIKKSNKYRKKMNRRKSTKRRT